MLFILVKVVLILWCIEGGVLIVNVEDVLFRIILV